MEGILSSIELESLFTNVLLHDTIGIIRKNAYSHASPSSPPFNEQTLEKLLEACTSQYPFTHMDGKIYIQNDRVTMAPRWESHSQTFK